MAVLVKNANRMMASASVTEKGIEVVFVDGLSGVIPFADIPELKAGAVLQEISLPNPYDLVLRTNDGELEPIPWDFARHYSDESFRAKEEAISKRGRQHLGQHVRQLREEARLTQEELAARAEIGRATLIRIENGEHSPRYDTVLKLARALEVPLSRLLVANA